jgi:NAD(P)-dependent dehydrogenase (short-subunit alcohol dehydrogenase family)
LLGQLAVHGVAIKLDRLYEGRSLKDADLKVLLKVSKDKNPSPTTWLVNGARAKPYAAVNGSGPEKIQIDQQNTARTNTIEQPLVINSQEQTPTPEPGQRTRVDNTPPTAQPCGSKATRNKSLPHSGDGTSHVMLQYQQLMQRFLETQKSVMLNYLQGTNDHAEADTFEANQALQKLQTPTVSPTQQISAQKNSSEQAQIETHLNAEPPAQGAAAAPTAGEVSMDREGLTLQLLAIVSELTGYPQEMLDLDLDLEAELGIDSIKRVEILGYFLQFVFGTEQGEFPAETENLTQIKTLRQIIDHVALHKGSPGKSEPEQFQPASPDHTLEHSSGIQDINMLPRFTMTTVDAPLSSRALQLSTKRVILLTDDSRGIAKVLAEKLKRQGYEIALARFGEAMSGADQHCYNVKDSSIEAIEALVDSIRQRQGSIGGLVHLLPLKPWLPFEEIERSDWHERLQLDVRTLFYLLKLSENDLKQAAEEGASIVVAATGMGGSFGSDPNHIPSDFFPGNGAIPGLLKTVAVEWPEIRLKSVDLNLKEPNAILADHLLAEILSDDNLVEVGYDGHRRLSLDLVESPLSDRAEDFLRIDSSWVILVTGGARGITARVACELARRYRPTLILAGRSPSPPDNESDETAHLVHPKELKSALIAGMKSKGEPANLAKVEAAYQQLCKQREIRANLTELQKADAKVEYFQVDVRDENAFGHLIDQIYQQYGRIDGVIHGAGIIEDKLFTAKTWDSFTRVFATKVEGAFILSRKLRPETLKLMVLFSSVAGRFGNRGQGDYTAANEVVNKIGLYLNQQWPGRVISINWGPWENSGMVSPEVQRQFDERGVGLVSPDTGVEMFDCELRKGQKNEVEVVIGDGPWRTTTLSETDAIVSDQFLPLLQNLDSVQKNNGALELVKCLDTAEDLYLKDHLLDGKPVFPAAMAIELMTEAVQMGYPQWKISSIKDVRVFKGIVLDSNSRYIRLVVNQNETNLTHPNSIEIGIALTDVEQSQKVFYKAKVVLKQNLSDPAPFELPSHANMQTFSLSVEEAYQKWLFHGPRFQTIKCIDGISEEGMFATVLTSKPSGSLAHVSQGHWLIDPFVLDAGPQLAILWARNYLDMTPLPSSFQAVSIFNPFHLSSSIHCHFKVLEGSRNHTVHANVFFTDNDGRLIGLIEGLEATGSKSLNRLAGFI